MINDDGQQKVKNTKKKVDVETVGDTSLGVAENVLANDFKISACSHR